MDMMDGMISSLENVLRVIQNEGNNMTLDEMKGVLRDIHEKTKKALGDWNELEEEIKSEYPELLLHSEE